MDFFNTKDNFGLTAKVFHWAVAILVLLLLTIGFRMTALPSSPDKIFVYMMHKSFGITVLILMIGRLAWRFISKPPEPPATHQVWEKKLSKTVHFALYACVFLMPLSGWLMSSAGGFPANFFGLFSLPPLIGKNQAVFEFTRNFHEIVAYGILGLLALHFAGAFKHHFIDKDSTLQRMTSRGVGLWWGLMLAALAGLLWTTPVVLSQVKKEDGASVVSPGEGVQHMEVREGGWAIDTGTSMITFEATQYGESFTGKFKNFGGTIIFDPADLAHAYADIWIDIASIDTGSNDRDTQARSAEWFDTANFPRALFVADSFEKTGLNQYVAHGALTIRGQAELVDLPFTLDIRESPEGQAALMQAQITLDRLTFGVGQGQWQATDAIGGTVKIGLTILADQK